MFASWGRFVYRFRWLTLFASLVLVVATTLAVGALTMKLSTAYDNNQDLEVWRAANLIEQELPAQESGSFVLIFTAREANGRATDPAFLQATEAVLEPLRANAHVGRIDTNPAFVSRDGRRAFAIVRLKGSPEEAQEHYAALRPSIASPTLDIVATGTLAVSEDFVRVSEEDLKRSEIIGLPLALIVLLSVFGMVLWRLLRRSSLSRVGLALAITFGTLIVALVPLLIGGFTIVGGMAGIYALAHRRDVSLYAINIASMIGLGVAIDYSLFIISRFLEELESHPVSEAIERTIATTGKAVAFSGVTVAIGVAGMLFYHSIVLTSVGVAATLVVIMAVVYSLTFLPALLAICANGIAAQARRRGTTLSRPTLNAPRSTSHGMWHALAGGVMRHPWLTLIPLLTVLLIAGSPFLGLRLGWGGPVLLPEHAESRQGYELLRDEFAVGQNNEIIVVAHYPDGAALDAARVGQLYDYHRWLAGLPGVGTVRSVFDLPGPDGKSLPKEAVVALLSGPREALPQELQAALHQTVGAHAVRLSVLTPTDADSDRARAVVRAIRDEGAPRPGGAVLVGGETAFVLDVAASVKADTPRSIAFVVIATYIVLFLLLGSVLLPLKAVLMNLLSITASYGALVWIFQEGHLSGFLNFTPSSIDMTVPVMMFCLLFGLSMDYEVLLLSRMKEEWDRTHDNNFAVAEGLEQTGRLITGAAAIMTFVFGAFALAELVTVKSIGVGMALAVAVDALLIRTLLVPASMRLLGDLNWWAPAPLARLQQRLGLGHGEIAPAAPAQVGD
jgi:putative drug exporter of the RND superfamily